MKKIFHLVLVFSIPAVVLLLSNCRKEQFGKGNLSFSTDTLTFDTVFTSLGSTTKYFKVFNTDKKAVKISNIHLAHLVGTQFRISVDGLQGDNFNEVEIPAKDSVYVFVEVTVNPTSAATPFLIIDDVEFTTNGETSTVHLQAFGQNAHFHYGQIINGAEIWNNDLPHVVISHDTVPGVYVKCGGSLTINSGCKIFFANNSALFVEGTLNANATTWTDSIVFQGVRLEEYYNDKPGQWFGIVFLRSNCGSVPQGNFNHCIVNESSYGIYAGAGLSTDITTYLGPSGRPEVTIQNSIVENSLYNAVYGFNAKIDAENCIFHTAGENLVKFGLGGDYTFNQCTMYNGGSKYVDHQKESLFLSNLVSDGTNTYLEPLKTTFTNCVVYGSLENEVSFNNAETAFTNFDNAFHYCDVKTKQDTFELFSNVHDNILFNQEPRFEKAEEFKFTPSDSAGFFSPLIDDAPTGLSEDIYGKPRPVSKTTNTNKFDLGAIEAP